jgi:O-antigen ligase/cytochrome c-type biogenesis protein CcmH/NrfG
MEVIRPPLWLVFFISWSSGILCDMKLNDFLKYFVLVGLFATLLVPLVVTNSMFFPFITGKAFVFRVLVELITGAWIILAIRDVKYRPKFSWILGAYALFMVILTLADAFGLNPEKSFWSNFERMEGWITHVHLFFYFLVASAILNAEKLWRAFFNTSLGVSAFLCGYGLLQLAGALEIHQGGRLDATLGNATYFAVYLLIHIFLALYFFLRNTPSFGGRIYYGILIILQLVILYFTETRGAILGLLSALATGFIVYAVLEKKNIKYRNISLGILGAIVLLVFSFILIRNTQFVQQNKVLSRFAQITLDDAAPRLAIWKMSIQGFKERPILGWGQENFNYVFNKYYEPKMYAQEQWFDRAHSVFFDWLIAGGILGLLGYLSLFVLAFYYIWGRKEFWKILLAAASFVIMPLVLWKATILGGIAASLIAFGAVLYLLKKKYPFEKESYEEEVALTMLLIAYFVHNIFVFDNLISYIFFFSFLAFLHSRSGREIPALQSGVVKNDGVLHGTAIVVGIATLVAVWAVNAGGFSSNRTLIKALTPQSEGPVKNLEYFQEALAHDSYGDTEIREQLVQYATNVAGEPTIDQNLRQQFLNVALTEFNTQIAETPNDARYYMFAGLMLNRLNFHKEAVPYFEKAVELSPNKQTLIFELGLSYLNSRQLEKSLAVLKRAFELEPSFGEARLFYAMAAIANKDQKLAQSLLIPVYGTDEINNEKIIKAYLFAENHQKLINIFKKGVAENPNNVTARISLAVSYLNAGMRAESIAQLQEVVKIDPGYKAQVDRFISEIRAGRNPTK